MGVILSSFPFGIGKMAANSAQSKGTPDTKARKQHVGHQRRDVLSLSTIESGFPVVSLYQPVIFSGIWEACWYTFESIKPTMVAIL